jgi:hypothetical protein
MEWRVLITKYRQLAADEREYARRRKHLAEFAINSEESSMLHALAAQSLSLARTEDQLAMLAEEGFGEASRFYLDHSSPERLSGLKPLYVKW